jgi:hypothetical protein
MAWRRCLAFSLSVIWALICAEAALAAEVTWPCVQRRVGELSAAQMWAGPPIDAARISWRDDPAVASLARSLAARRTSLDEASASIQKFAEGAGRDKDAKLTLLFAGTFDLINSERQRVIAGIEHYAQKQQALAKEIDETNRSLQSGDKADPRRRELEEKLRWDTRIYDDRNQALTYVCESPVILEQRAFVMAREIASHLD